MNTGVKPQCYVLSQDRKALGLLFNTQYLPLRFQSCFLFRSGERGKKDLEASVDPWCGTRTGKNECSSLAYVTSSAFTAFCNPAFHPPKHNPCLQRKPNDFSSLFWPMQRYPRPRHLGLVRIIWGILTAHKRPDVLGLETFVLYRLW